MESYSKICNGRNRMCSWNHKKILKFDMEKRCTEVGLTFEDLFQGIVIGPKSAQDIGSLQSFVEEKGFSSLKVKISKSDCPLR